MYIYLSILDVFGLPNVTVLSIVSILDDVGAVMYIYLSILDVFGLPNVTVLSIVSILDDVGLPHGAVLSGDRLDGHITLKLIDQSIIQSFPSSITERNGGKGK